MIITKILPNKAGIYKIINLINNKVYIGKAINLKKRIPVHWNPSQKSSYFDIECKKFGKSNFDIEILFEQDDINNLELLALETAFIDYFNSHISMGGYNVCFFSMDATGLRRSNETKNKISESKMGIKNPRFGLEPTEEWRKEHSIRMKGKSNPSFRKEKSKETLLKIKEKRKLQDMTFFKRKVIQIDPKDNIIKIWPSATRASIEIWGNKRKSKDIHNCCQNKMIEAINFKWKYL